jgi:hypothetical protein
MPDQQKDRQVDVAAIDGLDGDIRGDPDLDVDGPSHLRVYPNAIQ